MESRLLQVVAVALMAGAPAVAPAAPTQPLALVGGTIYVDPMQAPIEGGVVLIEDGKIAAVGAGRALHIPDGTEVVDCSGMTVTAGFWNSHVHFFERKWADAAGIPAAELTGQIEDMLTRHGFTSVFDLGSDWPNTRRIRDRIESGEVAGPRIRSTGKAVMPQNPGIPADDVLRILGVMKPAALEVADASDAAVGTRALLAEGVDAIKVFMSAPSRAVLPDGALAAIAADAHRRGKLVFVHPNTAADVLAAVQGGADIIAHTTPYSPWDATLLQAMKAKRVALIPTLKIFLEFMRHDRLSARQQLADVELAELRSWVDSGGTVLFGTDASYVNYDPGEEYMLMASAGMSFRQILASLTTAPAARFGESRRLGRIETGLLADLVVLDQDPARSVRALGAVRYVVRDGRIIYRRSPAD
ncbi:MAG TPA: amidohydrolase family protein [Steroidobacteraceae bacterium]|nr:amidohydrolase family protein [Steroidobacteraceae bacterium]